MMIKRRFKKVIASVLLPALITLVPLTATEVFADGSLRCIFQKEQSIINYGIELMDMTESKAFDIYMALLNVDTDTTEIKIDFDTPIILDAKTQEEIATVDAYKLESVANDAQIAVDAFKADYPEIFWYDIENSKSKAVIAVENTSDGRQTYIIKGIRIIFEICPIFEGTISSAYDNVVSEINNVIARTEGMDRYSKLMYFHDYLCNKIEYSTENEDAFDMHGALITGKATCEGYSEAFKGLCDLAGIPCVIVRGKSIQGDGTEVNHMWNYCLMEDDKWYAVDVTWDDTGFTSYDFFLVGNQTVVMTNNRTFFNTHLAEGDFSFTGIHSFTYPQLSDTAYEVIEFMYGDVNGDAVINGNDALDVLKMSARLKEGNDAEKKAGDVDGNGVIDAGDALYVLQYAARIIDKFPVEM